MSSTDEENPNSHTEGDAIIDLIKLSIKRFVEESELTFCKSRHLPPITSFSHSLSSSLRSASASAASSLGGSNGTSTPLSTEAGSAAAPPLPIQPGNEAATAQELQNFKLATGTEPLNSSNNPNDFKPNDPNLQVAQ